MKKFLTTIISFVLLILLMNSCTIYIARTLLSEDSISMIFTEVTKTYKEEYNEEALVSTFHSPYKEIYPDMKNYFNEQELEKEVSHLIAAYLYNLSTEDKGIDLTNLQNMVYDSIEEYEAASGNQVPIEVMDEGFNEINKQLDEITLQIGEFSIVFEFIFSNEIFTTLISGIVLCVVLIFILLGKVRDTLLKVKNSVIFTGSGTFFAGLAVNQIFTDEMPSAIVEMISAQFFKVGLPFIVVGIAMTIMANVLKNNKSIENSNNAIEKLGSVNQPINPVSNNPFNNNNF